jgi:enamine deaminase RidA (YjgF/YER057c/UK114 family)
MSHLEYFAYKGWGEKALRDFAYNQAVRVGDRIECSGQGTINPPFMSDLILIGGWNNETFEFYREINAQIDQAFENVDRCLKDAGGKGWSQVFKVVSYHVPLNNEALEAMVRNFRKWMPDHKPIWTVLGVQRLGEDDMRVEIDVVAHDPKE